jgi:hypothetical protein
MRCLLLLPLCVSLNSFASETLKIKQINLSTNEILVVSDTEIDATDIADDYFVTLGDNKQCPAKRIKKDGNKLFLSLNDCPKDLIQEIKVGDSIEKSMFDSKGPIKEEKPIEYGPVKAAEDNIGIQHDRESWYYQVSFGFSDFSYDSETRELTDELDTLGDKISINMEFLTFYFPLHDQNLLLGFSLTMGGERWTEGNSYVDINQFTYSFSAQKYFGPMVGVGPFLRADIGLAVATVSAEGTDENGDRVNINDRSSTGIGTLLGVGYSFPITPGTRMFFMGSWTRRDIENGYSNGINLTAGFLI